MILALDVGNSRLKWGLFDDQVWQRTGWIALADIAALGQDIQTLVAPAQVVVSNVAGPRVRLELENLLTNWNCNVTWVSSQAEQCGVRNCYKTPSQLGSDRWAALIAAWRHLGRSCVVVNAGTAMTVDALSDRGEFLGGLIVPGLTTMQKALAANTAELQVTSGRYADFPTQTEDAILSGAILAMAGAVEKMLVTLGKKLGNTPSCLISGGDAAFLAGQLSVAATIVDNLVLEGLIEIAQA